MSYKRILTIQDISCIGQCSMTVALPILSACGHETCILPAAVLSTHTGGFGKPAVTKLTDMMPACIRHWQDNGITFDVIYVGYLGSTEAVNYAAQIMDSMLAPGGNTVVDPAMADHGRLYSGLDESYAKAMTDLCFKADIMMPNVTEAAMMTGMPYREDLDRDYIETLLTRLGGHDVVLTGVGFTKAETGAAVRSGGEITCMHHSRIDRSYHGTGDIFAACFTGAIASGKDIRQAVAIASEYTKRCIQKTYEEPAHWYGVRFESVLPELIEMLK